MRPGHHIDYKGLRAVNADTVRMVVDSYLRSCENITHTSRVFGINRSVVYDILRKD